MRMNMIVAFLGLIVLILAGPIGVAAGIFIAIGIYHAQGWRPSDLTRLWDMWTKPKPPAFPAELQEISEAMSKATPGHIIPDPRNPYGGAPTPPSEKD